MDKNEKGKKERTKKSNEKGMYKLKEWVQPDKLDWQMLCRNPKAIRLLEQNQDKIDWYWLSSVAEAIHLLQANPERINWHQLSRNTSAIHLLEANPDRVECLIYENPAIFVYDYEGMKQTRRTLLDSN